MHSAFKHKPAYSLNLTIIHYLVGLALKPRYGPK